MKAKPPWTKSLNNALDAKPTQDSRLASCAAHLSQTKTVVLLPRMTQTHG